MAPDCTSWGLGQCSAAHLVGEGAGHDEGGVAGGAAKVEQAALCQDDDAVAVWEDEAVALGLDVLPLDTCSTPCHSAPELHCYRLADLSVVLRLHVSVAHEPNAGWEPDDEEQSSPA